MTFEPLSDSWQKAWYHSYVIYKQSGHDCDVGGHDFMSNGGVPEVQRANGRFPICWLLRYRGGPLEVSGMVLLVVRL